jgi:hypothetical protein
MELVVFENYDFFFLTEIVFFPLHKLREPFRTVNELGSVLTFLGPLTGCVVFWSLGPFPLVPLEI